MINAIIFYLWRFLKTNRFFYFFSLLFLFLLYYETFGLNIDVSKGVLIENLWIDGDGDITNYRKHLGLHFILIFLAGMVLLVNATGAFFSKDYLNFILIKNTDRKKVILSYVFVLMCGIFSFVSIHLLLLNILLYLISGSAFFLPSFQVILLVIPLIFFLSTVITCFSIIFKSAYTNLSVNFIYLFLGPLLLQLITMLDYEVPSFLRTVATNHDWFIPLFVVYIGDIFEYAFDGRVFPFWQGYFLLGCFFLSISILFFKRKIY